jgi:short-chain fatty acids transporter
MLVWHGGISGSAPLKAAETGHLAQLMGSVATHIPANVPLTETIFSPMNGLATLLMLGLIPLVLYRLALVAPQKLLDLKIVEAPPAPLKETGAAQFDNGWGLSKIIAALILTTAAIKPFFQNNSSFLQTLTPDFVNFILLGLGLLLHKNLRSFSAALDEAIGGIAGILIQFPLYFGIIAIVRESGLMGSWAQYFSEIATVTTFPVFTFFSAALINLFIPSGGGQWSVQGPVLIQTAQELGVPLGKCIMALAYGDQLTNMLQPFWALPLLGITGLKAKEVLPYTILMLLAGLLVFVCVLMVF